MTVLAVVEVLRVQGVSVPLRRQGVWVVKSVVRLTASPPLGIEALVSIWTSRTAWAVTCGLLWVTVMMRWAWEGISSRVTIIKRIINLY